MDKSGYERINSVLEHLGPYVTPTPYEGKDLVYVTIDTAEGTPANMLNALGRAGLLFAPSDGVRLDEPGPKLEPIGVTRSRRNSITFKDIKGRDY